VEHELFEQLLVGMVRVFRGSVESPQQGLSKTEDGVHRRRVVDALNTPRRRSTRRARSQRVMPSGPNMNKQIAAPAARRSARLSGPSIVPSSSTDSDRAHRSRKAVNMPAPSAEQNFRNNLSGFRWAQGNNNASQPAQTNSSGGNPFSRFYNTITSDYIPLRTSETSNEDEAFFALSRWER